MRLLPGHRNKVWQEERAAKDAEFKAQRAEMAGEHFDKEVRAAPVPCCVPFSLRNHLRTGSLQGSSRMPARAAAAHFSLP